jgi:hypothetical protein
MGEGSVLRIFWFLTGLGLGTASMAVASDHSFITSQGAALTVLTEEVDSWVVFYLVGGKGSDGKGHLLHVNEDGSVRCQP